MIAGVNLLDARTENSYRAASSLKRASMSSSIYTAGKSGNDSHPTLGQIPRQHQGRILTIGGRFSRTNYRYTGLIQTFRPGPFYVKRYWRIINLSQQ